MRSFKSNENIHKKEGGSYSSVTLQSPGNESQRKHTAILRISNRQSIQTTTEINQNGVQINKNQVVDWGVKHQNKFEQFGSTVYGVMNENRYLQNGKQGHP